MVPAPEYLVEVSLKVLSSKAMIDSDKGALDLRIDGFQCIDVRPETGAGILSGTVIDHMMCGKCSADFAISPIAISHQNRMRFHPFCHDWPKRCALGVRNQGRLGLTIAVSGNKHDRLFGASPPLVFEPFFELGGTSDEGFIDLNYSAQLTGDPFSVVHQFTDGVTEFPGSFLVHAQDS